jgi:hypothetical protein
MIDLRIVSVTEDGAPVSVLPHQAEVIISGHTYGVFLKAFPVESHASVWQERYDVAGAPSR